MGATVRHARADDLRFLAGIHVASWRAGYRGLVRDEHLDGLSVEKREARWREKFPTGFGGDRAVWLVLDEGVPAGFSDGGPTRDGDDDPETLAEITTFYLHPDHWRRGLGRMLMEHVLDELRERGFAECTLWVLRDNPRAVGFYEAVGFSRDGADKKIVIGGEPLVEARYRRTLARE